jgi:HAD superfamily hydrolase (TIGR01509 family)
VKRTSVLLFDLGGVLVDVGTFDAVRAMVGATVDDDELKRRWLRSPAVRSFELGRVSPDAFAAQFVEEWQVPVTPEAFLCEVHSWIRQPYPGAMDLLERLRVGHHVACLTNCNELHWSQLTPLLNCFDSAFSSHLLGEIKPDPKAFEAVMSELGVEPHAVRFFDDSRPNVEAARRLGIESFQVNGLDDVLRVVTEGGLL